MRIRQQIHCIFALAVILSLLVSGCQQATTPAPTPTPTRTLMPTPTPALTPTLTPEPASTLSSPIGYLVDVEKAVIRVMGQGRFFEPKVGKALSTPGYASGFIIDPSGIAVTASQAVVGADQVQLWVGEDQNTVYTAKVLGTIDCYDLAVIKIDGQDFDYLQWSDDPPTAGQKIFVSGFSLGAPKYKSNQGIVSETELSEATSRVAGELLHFEAKTLPGYVGGPVVNPEGKLVGVNLTGDPDSENAIGLTALNAQALVNQLLSGQDSPTIGVNGESVVDTDTGLAGVWIFAVEPGSIAERSGLRSGDLITNLAGDDLAQDGTMLEYCKALSDLQPTEVMDVQIYRWSEGLLLQGQLNGRPLSLGGASISGTPGVGTTIDVEARNPGDVYFTEEFDVAGSDWTQFLTAGDPEKVTTTVKDGKLRIQINSRYTYVYQIFEPLKVANAKIELTASNLGRNNNNVSLICRKSDRGWYEFNIANNGLYWVKRYDPNLPDADKYINIGKGGSKDIKMGRATNQYAVSCKGNQLTLWINGKEAGVYTDYALLSGKVGLSVSSFEVLPVVVEFENFVVSVP